MQIKPESALGRALTNAPRTKSERDAEQLEKLQNTLVASIAEKRRKLAALTGDEATALRANIVSLEKMLDGAFEMGAQLDAPDEQLENEQRSDEQRETDARGVFNAKAIGAQHRAARYGHAAGGSN